MATRTGMLVFHSVDGMSLKFLYVLNFLVLVYPDVSAYEVKKSPLSVLCFVFDLWVSL